MHFLCSQHAARMMAKKGSGVIINMSSGGATRAHRAFSAYDASKGGIEALTRAMALDLGPYGIRVCALMPGSIDTEGMGEEATARCVEMELIIWALRSTPWSKKEKKLLVRRQGSVWVISTA